MLEHPHLIGYPSKGCMCDSCLELRVQQNSDRPLHYDVNKQECIGDKMTIEATLEEISKTLKRLDDRAAKNRQDRFSTSKQKSYGCNNRDEIIGCIKRLNRLVTDYPDYAKINAPLLSALKEMGLTTSAVKVVASVNDEQIPF